MINKNKLNDDLTEMFIHYQWRLENPIPMADESHEKIITHYRSDYLFHNKVKHLVYAVMTKVSDAELNE